MSLLLFELFHLKFLSQGGVVSSRNVDGDAGIIGGCGGQGERLVTCRASEKFSCKVGGGYVLVCVGHKLKFNYISLQTMNPSN